MINFVKVLSMAKKITIWLLLAFCSTGFAQKTLIVEKIGTSTRYAYHIGDEIKIKTRKDEVVLKNYIWSLADSSLTIGSRTQVQLGDIGAVYKQFHFPKLMTKFFIIAGAGYLIIDSFNNLINKEKVFEPQTMIISASLIGVGVALIPLSQKKCRIGFRWKLKVLDRYIE
jgi:hypothetical protein